MSLITMSGLLDIYSLSVWIGMCRLVHGCRSSSEDELPRYCPGESTQTSPEIFYYFFFFIIILFFITVRKDTEVLFIRSDF